mgnify:FL=1
MAIPAAHVLIPWNLFTTRAQVGDTLMIEHRPVMSTAANAGDGKIDRRENSDVTYTKLGSRQAVAVRLVLFLHLLVHTLGC